MDEPLYPSVQGQPMPDLGLAQYSVGVGVATPQTAIHTNSDSTGPIMTELPELDSFDHDPGMDIPCMGIDPTVPYFDLELANNAPVRTPGELAAPQRAGEIVEPTFTAPDLRVPALLAGDLTGPGIEKRDEWEPDPALPDLLAENRPGGLDIIAASRDPLTIDPMAPDLDEYDRPAGLDMPGPLVADPALPDLQEPELEQEIHMTDRPGDLASDALDEMHDDETYRELPTTDYKELWMQQRGQNTHRSRRLGMLDLGLDKEESGR